MARMKKATTAKKVATNGKPATKKIRRRNEANEVVEIEVEDVPVEKATVNKYVETTDKLLERRKMATNHLASIEGRSKANIAVKTALGKAISAIDKRIAILK